MEQKPELPVSDDTQMPPMFQIITISMVGDREVFQTLRTIQLNSNQPVAILYQITNDIPISVINVKKQGDREAVLTNSFFLLLNENYPS